MNKIACLLILMLVFISGLANCMYKVTETLTTVGATEWVNTSIFKNHSMWVTTTGVSTNVIYQFEGSPDGIATANIEDTDATFTETTNTTKDFHKDNWTNSLLRLKWISKSGTGTTPNVKFTYLGGN